ERYTKEAVGFIEANKDRPFFLYLPHTAVHTPIWPGAAFAGKSDNGRFGDWVEEVDWSVGRVVDTLRELKLDEKTLVVFTTDNGPWLIKGPDGGSAGPLRGGKGSTWEGGVRVPTIAWWPGKIPAGSVCDAVAGTIDLLPTAVALAGGQVSAERVIDGRDITPLLLGKSKDSQREAHYYFSGYNLQAVRQGPWKLAIATQPETMGRGAEANATKNPRLYNLDEEIGEQTDVSDKHPEIVARLQALAEKMSGEIGGEAPAARRPAGEAENPVTLYPSEARQSAGRSGKKGAARSKPVEPADLRRLKPGDAVAAEAVPQVAGRPFTVRCKVATERRDGVIVAHGGSAAGYALHLRGGQVVFSVRDKWGVAEVETVWPTGAGPQSIAASLQKDGSLSLRVGDGAAVTAQGKGLLSRQPQEDFCVGHDNKAPLTAYSNAAFEGQITDLEVTSP
ncbi:MAG: sulfatase-like hydrolase/transferase, partial [Thermoguttaceae bacterium]